MLPMPDSLEISQLSAIARLFSASVIREMSRKGKSLLFRRLAKGSTLLDYIPPSAPVRDLFDVAFSLLKKKNYRHEYIYKSAITHKILLGTHSLQTSVMLNEFRAGSCKADVVIINGTSAVYEIKSERDTLTRLEQQVFSYRRVFANVNIITGENHLSKVLAIVPEDVGVLLLTDRFQISTIREPLSSPERTLPKAIFKSLQSHEVKKILSIYNIDIPRLPNTQMREALKEQFVKLTPCEAHQGMIQVLKTTRSLLPLTDLISALPDSLQSAALSTSIRKGDHPRLLEALDTSVCSAMNW